MDERTNDQPISWEEIFRRRIERMDKAYRSITSFPIIITEDDKKRRDDDYYGN